MSPEFPASAFGWVLLALGIVLAAVAASVLVARRPLARRMLARRWFPPALAAAVSLLVSIGISLVAPPVPRAFDEFSYLLAGDTFARGRLANPPPPHREHFEAAHILVAPSCQSKYPPAQGLAIALGAALTGLPIAGIWLSFAAACAVLPWALRPWVGPRGAALGALAAAVHPGLHLGHLLSWSQSWSGGAVAFFAGSLVFGAAARLARRPLRAHAAVFGAGAGILALARPWEGLIACIVAGGFVAWRLARARILPNPALAAVLLAAAAPFLAFLGVYNRAVTGSAFTMPYALHESRYGSNPLFLWQDPLPAPRVKCPDLTRQLHAWTRVYEEQRTLSGFGRVKSEQFATVAELFPGHWLLVLLVYPAAAFFWRRSRRALALAALGTLVIAGNVWVQPHYLAPFVLLFLVPLAELWRRHRRARVLSAALLIVAVGADLFWAAGTLRDFDAGKHAFAERARMSRDLAATGGKHLVLVRYRCEKRLDFDWVYNEADLDSAPVVWAREIDEAGAAKVVRSFPDRVVWVVEVRDEGISIQVR